MSNPQPANPPPQPIKPKLDDKITIWGPKPGTNPPPNSPTKPKPGPKLSDDKITVWGPKPGTNPPPNSPTKPKPGPKLSDDNGMSILESKRYGAANCGIVDHIASATPVLAC